MDFDPCSLFLPLGSAIEVPKYAKGVTYSDTPAYLPGFGPGAGTAKTSWWPWALGAAVVIGGVSYWVSKGGVFWTNPGRAKKTGFTAADADPKELARGTKHEMEHTDDVRVARRIALDHLAEMPDYYRRLEKVERAP